MIMEMAMAYDNEQQFFNCVHKVGQPAKACTQPGKGRLKQA